MAGQPKQPPSYKRLTLFLDGNDSRFYLDLKEGIFNPAVIMLVGYNVIDTPSTGLFPNNPALELRFEGQVGFQINTSASNRMDPRAIPLVLSGPVTNKEYPNPGIIIGQSYHGSTQWQVTVSVRDINGVEHNPVTNKLFQWITLELQLIENRYVESPLSLLSVPTIQQTRDTL